jgi:phage baseplate assembly protein W
MKKITFVLPSRNNLEFLKLAYANLKNLLQTVPKDRYYHPSFGCNLMSIIFEPSTEELRQEINIVIIDAISTWLPYLEIVELDIKTAEDDIDSPNTVYIKLVTALNGIELQPVIIFADEAGIVTIK